MIRLCGGCLLRKRIFFSVLAIMLVLIIWEMRLLWLQTIGVVDTSSDEVNLVEQAVNQRMVSYVLDDGRARFVDRDGRSLGGEERQVLVVFPQYRKWLNNRSVAAESARLDASLRNVLGADERDWRAFLGKLNSEARVWQAEGSKFPLALSTSAAEQLKRLSAPGLAVATQYIPRSERTVAEHVLGLVGENAQLFQQLYRQEDALLKSAPNLKLGVSGLERSLEIKTRGYQSAQSAVGERRIAWVEPAGELRRIETNNPYYPLQVVTTIDREWQSRVEQTMKQFGVREGAVVVLDRHNADVLVMAGRPSLLDQPGHQQVDLRNHALLEMKPGSIFKLVVGAAALGEGVVDRHSKFHCAGSYGKYKFTCWRRSGHGDITASQAFALSCNIAFAEMAKRLSPAIIEAYATRLGLAQQVGWGGVERTLEGSQAPFRLLPDEQAGVVFAQTTDKHDEGALMQTAIGQRDVLLTPLQAANMVATILNDGELRAPRVVREIRYRNGQLRESFAPQVLRRGDAKLKEAAPVLRTWMRETVRSGTAQSLSKASVTLAGKTGTAQVKLGGERAGEEVVNQWFVGYDVADERYAVAVVVEHMGPNDRQVALPIAMRVMNILTQDRIEQAP